uniref:Uncharacterized protein n=1 Tax=Nelumbo nucifera TaxID=4432 RepID=A0A822XMD5_NELNU|nr:TPA_asm: hypothetical protein HUJ06_022326 [Nelumbo nucifera]
MAIGKATLLYCLDFGIPKKLKKKKSSKGMYG